MCRGDERCDIGSDAEAPINFIVDGEIGKPGRNRMILGDNSDWNIDVMLVANLGCYDSSLALFFKIPSADDLFVVGPILVGDQRMMEHHEAGPFIEEREKVRFLRIGN